MVRHDALHAEGPPTRHTGGFGEDTCYACHFEYPLNGVEGELRVEGIGDAYRPGAVHTVTVLLRAEGTERAGFQTAIRHVAGPREGRSAGSVQPVDSRVAVRSDDDIGVDYVQHTLEGTVVPEGSDLTSWTFHWTSPEEGGAIAIDVAANSGNGDNSPLGDVIFTTSLVLEPGARPGSR